MPETRVQSSVAESESPAARAHTGGSAVPREAARQGHRASAGRHHLHPPNNPNRTLKSNTEKNRTHYFYLVCIKRKSSSLTCLIQPSKAKNV